MKQKILAAIQKFEKIICLRHISPDGDAYGSAYGLAQVIKDNFPNKKVLCGGLPADYLNFLYNPDVINSSDYLDALVIVTDTPVISRIDGNGWEQAKMIIKIDHHPFVEKFADLEWIEEDCISASQMIGDLILNSNLKLTALAAQLILTGIITDSNRFLYFGTSSETLLIASKLVAAGAKLPFLYENLYEENLIMFNFKNYLKSLIMIQNKTVASIKVTSEILTSFNFTYEQAKSLVNIMAGVKEFSIWVYLIENKAENYINVSIRSKKIAINQVAAKYNGGGHKLASGCRLSSWEEAKNLLLDLEKLT